MPKVSVAHEQHQREKIIAAAATCICHKGFHQTTIQDICEEAGLSKGGLYTYFRSKEEILEIVVKDRFIGALEQAAATAQAGGTSLEKLDRVEDTVIGRMVSQESDAQFSPQLLSEIWAEASKNPRLRSLCAEAYERWTAFLAGLLREGVARGEFKPDVDPNALAAILVAVFDGLSLQEEITRARVDWQHVAQTLRWALGEGIFAKDTAGRQSAD